MDWSIGSEELTSAGPKERIEEANFVHSKNVLLGAAFEDTVAVLSGAKEVSVYKISLNSTVSQSPFYSHSDAKNYTKSAWGTISKNKLSISLDTQPSVIAIGSDHVAAGLNTIAWFYALPNQCDWTFPSAFRAKDEPPVILVRNMEYVAIIKDIRLNSHYCATLFTDGRIHLHLIDPSLSKTDGRDATRANGSHEASIRMNSASSFDPDLNFVMDSEFGDRIHSGSSLRLGYNGSSSMAQVVHGSGRDSQGDDEQKLIEGKERYSCIDLTEQLLVYGSFGGVIEFFYLKDWTVVDVYRHTSGIKSLSADVTGTRIGVIDEYNKIFIYNSVTGEVMDVAIDDLPTLPTNILWDKLGPSTQAVNSTSSNSTGAIASPSPSSSSSFPICTPWPDPNDLFIAYDSKNIYIHCFIKQTIEGKGKIEFVASMNLPFSSGNSSLKIIHLLGGMVYCQSLDSLVTELPLVARGFVLSIQSFSSLAKDFSIIDRAVLGDSVLKDLLKLRRYRDAFKLCEYLNDNEHWKSLGQLAMHDLQVDLAIAAYSRMYPSTFGMVLSLKSLSETEEKTLLAGHLSVFLGEYELAQQLFLKSSCPEEALHLCQNLQDWQTALVLAKRLSPHLIPVIAKEYASQLELTQDFDSALVYYEKALDLPPHSEEENEESFNQLLTKAFDGSKEKLHKHKIDSCAGIARNSLRVGNTSRGLEILSHSNFKSYPDIQLQCARILESIRLYSDAAVLYENAHEYFKAATLYLQVKNVNKVSKLLELIDTKQAPVDEFKCLFSEYAKIQEQEHRFKEAIKAYEKIGDTLQVIRILLEKVRNPTEAMKLARESRSVEAKMKIAKFFQSIGEIPSALEFLVLSNCNSEAFQLASATGQMDVYANFLLNRLEDKSDDEQMEQLHKDLRSVALFYESEKNLLWAGKFHYLSGNSRKGVKLLLASIANRTPGASESEAIELAIEAAAKSKDDSVIGKVIDFLVGDVDGVARDFKYLFRLYMKLGHFKDAAKTAVTIANEEQATGNYRSAHTMLLKTSQELAKHCVRMPTEMASSLLLIHSYLLSKVSIFALFILHFYKCEDTCMHTVLTEAVTQRHEQLATFVRHEAHQ